MVPVTYPGKVTGMLLALGGVIVVATSLNAALRSMLAERNQAAIAALDDARKQLSVEEHGTRSASKRSMLLAAAIEAWQAARPLLFAVAAGSALGWIIEGWHPLDASYFVLISILTVGYGDFTPQSTLGHVLTILLLPLGVACAGQSVATLSAQLLARSSGAHPLLSTDGEQDAGEKLAVLERLLRDASDGTGVISEADFICSTLLETELVDAQLLAKVRKQFYLLDTESAGALDMASYFAMQSSRRQGKDGGTAGEATELRADPDLEHDGNGSRGNGSAESSADPRVQLL